MTTPVVLGSTREMWFANLSDSAPQWSFLEDPVGTSKTSGQLGRSQRLGDPINTGPNSTWGQLTFQGGEGQDVWKDPQMYQYGELDVLSYTGKARMWPGLQSWWKHDTVGWAMGAAMCEGSASRVSFKLTPLYVGMRDIHSVEPRSGAYLLLRINPGYTRGDPRAVETLHYWNEPYRFIVNPQGDDYSDGWLIFTTATKMFVMYESNPATSRVFEDTNAPATTAAHFEYDWDTAAAFNGALYYGHGNRLYKRVPKPPFGTLGTHTLIKKVDSARRLRGMCVWNNRLYFGVQMPNGKSEVMVSDGATTVKAFEFPSQIRPTKMIAVAGALYIMGYTYSGIHIDSVDGTIMQQVWRYDGVSLKKLWQQGTGGDRAYHWHSDLIEHDGKVVWARQGTMEQTVGINMRGDNNKARLVFYDPVNDAIVGGPGLAREQGNVGRPDNDDVGTGLWITGLCNWNNTIAVYFKDITSYSFKAYGPVMLASVRPQEYVRNDLRWPHTGDVPQFDANTGFTRQFLQTSEYHGEDDVATERKTWLSLRMRCRVTKPNCGIEVHISDPNNADPVAADKLIATITSTTNGTTNWKDVIIPLKIPATGLYQTSTKLQVRYELYNESGHPDDTGQCWIDDTAVQYIITPSKVRQWNVRIPLSDAQANLHGGSNSLATADTLAQKLEDLYFNGLPVKFWEPSAAGTTPANGAYVEARIISFNRQQSRLATDETSLTGTVSMTLVENVLT